MRYKTLYDVNLPGVYLLWRNNKVIYVGQTNFLFRRIKSHNHHNFDEFSFELILEDEKRAKREKELIDKYNPVLNKINSKQPVSMYGSYGNRKIRWRCEEELISEFGIENLSSRILQKLLKNKYGIDICHSTANTDLQKFIHQKNFS